MGNCCQILSSELKAKNTLKYPNSRRSETAVSKRDRVVYEIRQRWCSMSAHLLAAIQRLQAHKIRPIILNKNISFWSIYLFIR